MGKWILIGAAVAGAGILLLATGNHGGGSPNFGMAYYGGAPGANLNTAYGMGMYGGFHDSGLKPVGYWKPATLQRYQ